MTKALRKISDAAEYVQLEDECDGCGIPIVHWQRRFANTSPMSALRRYRYCCTCTAEAFRLAGYRITLERNPAVLSDEAIADIELELEEEPAASEEPAPSAPEAPNDGH